MRASFIVATFALTSAFLVDDLESFNCIKYTCHPELSNKNLCMKYDGNQEVYVQKCSNSSHVCDSFNLETGEASCSPYYTAPRFHPGVHCVNNAECYSGICNETTRVCQGLTLNTTCVLDRDCNAGLFCLRESGTTGTCTVNRKKNEPCDEKYLCASNLVCDCKECVEIGSKKDSATAEIHEACSSFFVFDGACTKAPKFKEQKEGNVTHTCAYEYSSKEIKLEAAVCGMNKAGKRYCHAGRGDINMKPYLDYIRKDKNGDRCHVDAGPLCQYKAFKEMSPDYYAAYTAFIEFNRNPLLQDNEACMKEVINKEYWAAKAENRAENVNQIANFVLLAVTVAAFFLALIFFFVYFRIKVNSETTSYLSENTTES